MIFSRNRSTRMHYIKGRCTTCGTLRDLVPFVQYHEREKQPWRSITFSKVAD